MKTLKRSLAMVLALVMVLGVMSISAGAAFEDGDKIQYNEAVDVLVGLKAIEGFPDGTFRADANVTRAQACKLIAYAMLGDKAASKLTCQEDPFTDVKANNWAAPYIAYCVSKGIVQGYGDGTFGPDKNVTGIQLATMLLRVLGRGQMNEYTGKYWDVNAVADANKLDLFAGSKAIDFSAAATREETALYIFNALPAEMVTYSKLLEDYVATETTLMDTLGLVKVSSVGGAAVTDAYGYLGHYWTKNNVAITGVFADEAAAVTYVGGQTIPANTKLANTIEYWINGVKKADVAKESVKLPMSVPFGATASVVTDATGAVKKVVATVEYAAVVTEVYPATAVAKRTVDIKVFTNAGDYTVAKYETESFAKGDVLVVMPVGDNSAAKNFISIAAAEKVTGQFNAYRGVAPTYTAMRVGSTYYNINTNYETAMSSFGVGSTADFYLDTAGNIIYIDNVKTDEVALNYVYVGQSQSQAAGGDLISGSVNAVFKASIINPDGSKAVVNVATYVGADGRTYYSAPGAASATPKNTPTVVTTATNPIAAGFYTYTVDANGAYTFTALDTDYAGTPNSVTTAPRTATVTGINNAFANSKTNISVINTDATVKTTGIANFQNATYEVGENSVTAILYVKNGSAITDIIVIRTAANVISSATYAYYVGAGEYVYGEGQYHIFYVDGKVESYVVAEGVLSDVTMGDVCTIVLANNVVTELTEQSLEAAAKVIAVDETFFVLEGGTIVYFGENCKVFNVTTGVAGVADTLEVGDYVSYVKDGEAALVAYIVNAPVA